ncbi:thermonuclease family protein [Rhodoplanes azumiensis]
MASALAMVPAVRPAPAVAEPAGLSCGLAEIEPATGAGATVARATVAAVPDARTLLLADGREVLLAGLAPASADTPAGRTARAALAGLVEGRPVVLAQGTPIPDRWGRTVAWVTVAGDPPGPLRLGTLQLALLAQGHARVAARVEDEACRPALRAAERAARAANLGLWADPVYAAVPAAQPAEILKRRGRFAVVVGPVDSVRESGGTIYLNFGRRWAEGFAATIPKRIERTLAVAGLVPGRLAGRRVEVRGVVEQRGGGPRIEILRAEQLALDAPGGDAPGMHEAPERRPDRPRPPRMGP